MPAGARVGRKLLYGNRSTRTISTSIVERVFLQIMTSVMVKSAVGPARSRIWGKKSKTNELASLLLEGLIAGGE